MRISVIGTGRIGSTLVRRLSAAGHHVAMANSRGAETLTQLAAETGASARNLEDVAQDADVIVVSIPPVALVGLSPGVLASARPGAFVIDTGNYVPHLRDGIIEALEDGTVESCWTERILRRPVVKAFNTVKARDLVARADGAGGDHRVALPVAGDDPRAKAIAMTLVEETGFDAVDAGDLSESWRQQPGTPVYTTNLDASAVRAALASADRGETIAWRERMTSADRAEQKGSSGGVRRVM